MALLRRNLEPGAKRLQRIGGQARFRELRQKPDVERERLHEALPQPLRLLGQHGHVEADRVADQDAPGEERRDTGIEPLEGRCAAQRLQVEPVDGAGRGGDLNIAGDQALEGVGAVEPAAIEMDGREFDHPGAADIEPGGLGIDRDPADREQRCSLQQVRHAVVSAFAEQPNVI